MSPFVRKLASSCLIAALVVLAKGEVQAQTSASGKSLINARAAGTVERLFSSRRQTERTRQVVSRYSKRQSALVHDLQLDSVDSLIQRNRSHSEMFSSFKDIAYLSYARDVIDLEELLEIENSTGAQKVLLFESLRMSNEYIFKPLIGPRYDAIVRKLRALRDYTTVGVVKENSGSLGVQRGLGDDERLVEFKIHTSARYGLEPRVRFDDNLVFRYRPIQQEALLEFRIDF